MEIEKIEQLTALIKSARGLRFKVEDNYEIKIENNYHRCRTKKDAEMLKEQLQDAIEPIVANYEKELRKELAKFAK